MSTNARIGMVTEPGSVTSIYTHWDGYIEHHGPILIEHYTEPEQVRALIALGDLSSLGKTLGRKHDFDAHRGDETCNAYSRDRGETDVAARTHGLDAWPDTGQEYEYLYDPGRIGEPGTWRYRTSRTTKLDPSDWRPLTIEAVIQALEEQAAFFEQQGYETSALDAIIARLKTPA